MSWKKLNTQLTALFQITSWLLDLKALGFTLLSILFFLIYLSDQKRSFLFGVAAVEYIAKTPE